MLNESINTVKLHFNRASNYYNEVLGYTLSEEIFEDKDKVKTIDAFIFRFIKLQDFMSEKLFRRFLESVGEYKDSMSLLDVLDKLEKLEIIDNADLWIVLRKLRNQLTHEYPDNQQEMLAGIEMAVGYFESIGQILKTIITYSQNNKLV